EYLVLMAAKHRVGDVSRLDVLADTLGRELPEMRSRLGVVGDLELRRDDAIDFGCRQQSAPGRVPLFRALDKVGVIFDRHIKTPKATTATATAQAVMRGQRGRRSSASSCAHSAWLRGPC